MQAAGQRQHRERHIVLRHEEIVDHRGIGCLEGIEPGHVPRLVRHAIGKPVRERQVAHHIAEEDEFAGFRVDLGMSGEAPGPPSIIAIAFGGEADRIELERLMPLLQRKQAVRMPDDVGVGSAAVLAHHGGVRRHRIAEGAEQRLVRVILHHPFGGADIAVAVRDLAVLDGEGMDHPVAREPVIIGIARVELRIGAVAVIGAGQFRRDGARDLQFREIVFAADRGEIAAEIGIGLRGLLHGGL